MLPNRKPIPPEDFYGGKTARQDKIEAILRKEQITKKPPAPKFMTRLLGPSKTWKVFKKQQDAIECCLQRRNGLMCFAFEDINGRRMFLVAHPKVFWSINSHRFFKSCSTYEIIREYSACKLYLDIEFEYEYNDSCDGERMIMNLLEIINFKIKEIFRITVSRNDILDLDSSSNVKFSRHIIYEIKNIAFKDNYSVGNFIKNICLELKEAYENNLLGDSQKLNELSKNYNIPESSILELFVCDNKNKTKLLIDEAVYTKNRHFRVLGSSKQTKNIPLVVSKSNTYKPAETDDCSLFLDSLVTYFSWKVDRILELENSDIQKHIRNSYHGKPKGSIDSQLYPQIDAFISKLISSKGSVRRKIFFSDSSTIVYDIQGYRYCDNIKREHKSNNIKYIVDLENLVFYQKCYDPDCGDFRSSSKPLPDEIQFLFEDDSLFLEDDSLFPLCDKSVLEVMQEINRGFEFEEEISEEDLEKVVECSELIFDINW